MKYYTPQQRVIEAYRVVVGVKLLPGLFNDFTPTMCDSAIYNIISDAYNGEITNLVKDDHKTLAEFLDWFNTEYPTSSHKD